VLLDPKVTGPNAPLRVGDAILTVGGRSFASPEEFVSLARQVGDLELGVIRRFDDDDETPALEEYKRAALASIVGRVVLQTKLEARAHLARTRDASSPLLPRVGVGIGIGMQAQAATAKRLELEKDAPTGAANRRRQKRERKWAKKRAQIAAQRERKEREMRELQQQQQQRLDRRGEATSGDAPPEDAEAAAASRRRARRGLEAHHTGGALDLKKLDVRDNGIDDLGLARLVDVVRPNKAKHDSPGGFLVALEAAGNAQPLAFYRGRTYEDLYQQKVEEAKTKCAVVVAFFLFFNPTRSRIAAIGAVPTSTDGQILNKYTRA
jgi:hypothetical protein